jgi:hypothetical protein
MGHGRLRSILWFKLSSRNRFFPPITHPKIPVRTIQTCGLETIRKNSQILAIPTCYLLYGVEQNIKRAFLRRDVPTDLSCGGGGEHTSLSHPDRMDPTKGLCTEKQKKTLLSYCKTCSCLIFEHIQQWGLSHG